ncbi:MAG: hypothetical protein ACJ74H_10110 [Thermoanaerobaculia bacterium]
MISQLSGSSASLAINWFALALSSKDCRVAVATYSNLDVLPKAVRKVDHRSVFVREPAGVKIYHIGRAVPEHLSSETVSLTSSRSLLAKSLLELSFADACARSEFDVSLHHVGGTALRNAAHSIRPAIFRAKEGFSFRAFSFMEAERDEVRWGLILNYQTGQRFNINLSDPILRRLALNKRVIRVVEAAEEDKTGLLAALTDEHIVVAHRDGTTSTENPSDWVPQCRKDLLIEYIAATENRSAAAEVSNSLLRSSMALTDRGSLNVSLARDQITRVQALTRDFGLLNFRVVSVDRGPLIRMAVDPLSVETYG